MRIPTPLDRERLDASGAMTPMIDVVFLLLIFFVCAAAGQTSEATRSLDLQGQSAEMTVTEPTSEPDPIPPIWLYLQTDPSGKEKPFVRINSRDSKTRYPLDRITKTLTSLAEGDGAAELTVILDIDDDVPAGFMIKVHAACRDAKFQNIQFATDVPTGR